MSKSVLIACITFAVAGAPAAAEISAADPATPAQQQKLKDPNRMICEREDEIGTRLGGKKTCRTAKEWQDWRQQNREQVESWQRQLTNPGKPAG